MEVAESDFDARDTVLVLMMMTRMCWEKEGASKMELGCEVEGLFI